MDSSQIPQVADDAPLRNEVERLNRELAEVRQIVMSMQNHRDNLSGAGISSRPIKTEQEAQEIAPQTRQDLVTARDAFARVPIGTGELRSSLAELHRIYEGMKTTAIEREAHEVRLSQLTTKLADGDVERRKITEKLLEKESECQELSADCRTSNAKWQEEMARCRELSDDLRQKDAKCEELSSKCHEMTVRAQKMKAQLDAATATATERNAQLDWKSLKGTGPSQDLRLSTNSTLLFDLTRFLEVTSASDKFPNVCQSVGMTRLYWEFTGLVSPTVGLSRFTADHIICYNGNALLHSSNSTHRVVLMQPIIHRDDFAGRPKGSLENIQRGDLRNLFYCPGFSDACSYYGSYRVLEVAVVTIAALRDEFASACIMYDLLDASTFYGLEFVNLAQLRWWHDQGVLQCCVYGMERVGYNRALRCPEELHEGAKYFREANTARAVHHDQSPSAVSGSKRKAPDGSDGSQKHSRRV